ncbi:MAG: vWA domain-containing protein [Coraliomargaritaceae bacterium]
MIELKDNQLIISFPEVHPDAKACIDFQRTLRVPDDDSDYRLPPGMGSFDLRHIEDYTDKLPNESVKRGGVLMPMYQSEALWIDFSGRYPIAVKIGTGKINAISGSQWSDGLQHPRQVSEIHSGKAMEAKQDYVVIPEQPWLDGYCTEETVIRQFVAMPLGTGVTVEEQLNPGSEFGGIQIEAFPLRAEKWEAMEKERITREKSSNDLFNEPVMACYAPPKPCDFSMGIAKGGRIEQEIYEDTFDASDWDLSRSSRCWVHLCNSELWEHLTGEQPPHKPFSASEYIREGLPWFDHYSESKGVSGSPILKEVKSVSEFSNEGDTQMTEEATEILFILDRSGSMNTMTDEAISGFNSFLKDQRRCGGNARLSLTLFDHEYTPVIQSMSLDSVPSLDDDSYKPRGTTALLDAVGRSIDDCKQRRQKMPKASASNRVIVVVLTDGLENASKDYDYKRVQKLIEQQKKSGWEFLFLASDLESSKDAANFGFHHSERRVHKSVMRSMAIASQEVRAFREKSKPTL